MSIHEGKKLPFYRRMFPPELSTDQEFRIWKFPETSRRFQRISGQTRAPVFNVQAGASRRDITSPTSQNFSLSIPKQNHAIVPLPSLSYLRAAWLIYNISCGCSVQPICLYRLFNCGKVSGNSNSLPKEDLCLRIWHRHVCNVQVGRSFLIFDLKIISQQRKSKNQLYLGDRKESSGTKISKEFISNPLPSM
jgi:hypothetical protein